MSSTITISHIKGAHMRSRSLADVIDGTIATVAENNTEPLSDERALRNAERREIARMLSEIIEAMPISPALKDTLVKRVLDDPSANVLVR